jgi:hypothetical protein
MTWEGQGKVAGARGLLIAVEGQLNRSWVVVHRSRAVTARR